MSEAPVADRPAAMTTEQAADLIDCARGTLWSAWRDGGGIEIGDEVIRPLRVGRALRWPTAPILRALGLAPESGTADAAAAAPALTIGRSEVESGGQDAP